MMEHEINRWISAAAVVMWSMYMSAMVKRELSQNVRLSINWWINIPTLTYGYEFWIMTEEQDSRYVQPK